MTPLPPPIRHAEVGDARLLAECHVACWREAYGGVLPAERLAELTGDLEARTQRWLDILRNEPRSTWVAITGAGILGFASTGPARDEEMAHLPELYALYIRASEYGTGLADRLVRPAIGVGPAYLWVAAANPRALRYYENIGFRLDGGSKVDDWFGGIREVRMVRTDGSCVEK